MNCLESQNELPYESEIKVEFSMKTNKGGGSNVIFSMKPEAFKLLVKRDRVNINWERFNILEFIKPLQCYNCSQYGHMAKYCKSKKMWELWF